MQHHLRVRLRLLSFAVVVVAAAAGCPNCAPDQVGAGVARLTIRNVGAMATLVNADDNCGFASQAVLDAAVVDGEPGGDGSITLSVDGCEIDLGKGGDVGDADCNGKQTTGEGKVKISATRTISGFLTGDAANPIIPATADSLVITITKAEFTNFAAHAAGSDDFLVMTSGSISAKVSPRLAVAASSGACAIATPNTSFTDVKYAASTVHVDTPDNKFDADVADSNITAQNGVGGGGENVISGIITVFGNSVDAAGPDGSALDPDYKADGFVSGYSCTDDLASPESYDCNGFVDDAVQAGADGMARLTIQMLGTITGLVDENTECGFASDGALESATVSGDVGGVGTVTTTVTSCTIDLAAATNGDDDCTGSHSVAQGSVTITGTKAVTGRLTGDQATPVIPNDDHPATFTFTAITVDGFSVGSSSSNNALLARSGTLSGAVTPRTAATPIDSESQGACAVATPNAHFTNVAWADADLVVSSDSGNLELPVNAASLNAVNGNFDASTNSLSGSMTVAGEVLSVPSDNAGLNPDFDQAAFDASWQCNPELASPASFQCLFVGPIGFGAAQLSAQLFGTIVSMVDGDTTCGFASAAVGGTPTFTGGDVGDDDVEAAFDLGVDGCTITIPSATVISTNCVGHTTSFAGTITVKGTKKVVGFRTGDPTEPVVPTSSTPATFDLQIDLANTLLTTDPAGPATMSVHAGTLSGTARPVTALDPTTGACSIGTPNLEFAGLTWTDGDVTLVSGGKEFNMALTSNTGINATNGTFGANTNTLGGDIVVDGAPVPLGGALDPGFDQAAFDAAYQCAANGDPQLVPDAACSFRQVLGNVAARLLVKATGIGASVLKANDVCGFSAPAVAGVPTDVQGTPGGPGSIEFTSTTDCLSGFAQDTAISASCDADASGAPDVVTHAAGTFTTSTATLTIAGFLTGDPTSPVFPLTQDAAVIDITGAAYDNFNYFDVDPVSGAFQAKATFTGAIDAVVQPIAGESIEDSAAAATATGDVITHVFSEATPVAQFSALSTDAADMTIVVPGGIAGTTKTFHITIDSALLDAVNGSFSPDGTAHLSNSIGGDLTVDGEDITLDPVLVAGFDQATFDAEYAPCDADLAAAIAP